MQAYCIHTVGTMTLKNVPFRPGEDVHATRSGVVLSSDSGRVRASRPGCVAAALPARKLLPHLMPLKFTEFERCSQDVPPRCAWKTCKNKSKNLDKNKSVSHNRGEKPCGSCQHARTFIHQRLRTLWYFYCFQSPVLSPSRISSNTLLKNRFRCLPCLPSIMASVRSWRFQDAKRGGSGR